MNSKNPNLPRRQQGIVLVVGLIFLLVMTIIGVTSLSTTRLQEQMAGNMQQKTLAFQTSEAAVARFFTSANGPSSTLSTNDSCATDDTVTNDDINEGVENEACSEYLAITDPGRMTNIAFDTGQTSFVHFMIRSRSETAGNAKVTLNQGMFRLGPKAPSVLVESE